jgi:Ser/Thr protein kinase RdoA (MazF antagonist)
VAGVIDFGDMLRAPLIVEVAIAASYMRAEGDDALSQAISLAAGFDSVTRLDDREITLLYDLVRTRLATTITMMHWRKSVRSDDDAYLQQVFTSESDSELFLQKFDAVSREDFAARVRESRV